jgi:hypothetical protein
MSSSGSFLEYQSTRRREIAADEDFNWMSQKDISSLIMSEWRSMQESSNINQLATSATIESNQQILANSGTSVPASVGMSQNQNHLPTPSRKRKKREPVNRPAGSPTATSEPVLIGSSSSTLTASDSIAPAQSTGGFASADTNNTTGSQVSAPQWRSLLSKLKVGRWAKINCPSSQYHSLNVLIKGQSDGFVLLDVYGKQQNGFMGNVQESTPIAASNVQLLSKRESKEMKMLTGVGKLVMNTF